MEPIHTRVSGAHSEQPTGATHRSIWRDSAKCLNRVRSEHANCTVVLGFAHTMLGEARAPARDPSSAIVEAKSRIENWTEHGNIE